MRKLDDINWKYVPSTKTNITETLKRCGFDVPSEDKRYQEKWARYRNALSINEKLEGQ